MIFVDKMIHNRNVSIPQCPDEGGHGAAGAPSTIQLRNLRNPDAASETCVNNVGSFKCVDNEEENIAIGWGGHTTDGGHRYGAFR